MDEFDVWKVVAGLVSALGTVAVHKYNAAQSQKIRAELLERLDSAVKADQKHTACELFRLLHGLRMDYEDVKAICGHDKASKIILALQKTPGVVTHQGGRLRYTKVFQKKWVRQANRSVGRVLAWLMGALTAGMVVLMASLEGVAALAMLVFVIPGATFLALQLRDLRHDQMVESLVDEAAT